MRFHKAAPAAAAGGGGAAAESVIGCMTTVSNAETNEPSLCITVMKINRTT